jgi:hypothetical protein
MTRHTLAGVAQRSAQSEIKPPAEALARMPAARSTPAQVFADGLNVNEAARAQGYDDARTGRPWRGMASADPLSYALGYAAGESERGCCSGERAQGEAA